MNIFTTLVVTVCLCMFSACGTKEEAVAAGAAPAQAPAEPPKEEEPAPQPEPQPKPSPAPKPRPKPQPKPGPAPRPQPAPKPAPRPQPGQPPQAQLDRAIAWGTSRQAWTNAVRAVVRARFQHFDRASDKEQFCPGYSSASRAEQENCFVAIVAAIAKLESNFRPGLSFKEPDGNYSVGLLMLSKGECPNAPTMESLKNAIPNLICGTNKMASLITRDGFISGPPHKYGAAAYWSTLRNPYRKHGYKLGKKPIIIGISRNYRGQNPVKRAMALTVFDEVNYPLYQREDEVLVMEMLREEDHEAKEALLY